MSNKNFHIDINGKPAPCNAKQNCPRGGQREHFDSTEKAQNYADYKNELRVEADETLQSYHSGNISLEEISKSENQLIRLEAYYNGYKNRNILSEDYIVKKGLVENNLYTKELIADSDSYISTKALENYNKEFKVNLKLSNVDKFIQNKQRELEQNPNNEELRTEIAYLNRMKNPEGIEKLSVNNLFSNVSSPDGGATFNPTLSTIPTSGFCYSPYPELSKTIQVDNPVQLKKDLDNYLKENKEILSKDNHYIGIWNDPETGIVYLDISVNSMDSKESRKACENKDQIAYFDLQSFESVTVNKNATSGQSTKTLKDLEEEYIREMEEGIFS